MHNRNKATSRTRGPPISQVSFQAAGIPEEHVEPDFPNNSPVPTPTTDSPQPCFPRTSLSPSPDSNEPSFSQNSTNSSEKNTVSDSKTYPLNVGHYKIYQEVERSFNGEIRTCKGIDKTTGEEIICKIIPKEKERVYTQAYLRTCHENVARIRELLKDLNNDKYRYIIFDKNYGDLHNYIRNKKRLRELEAMYYFRQILEAVKHCHDCGLSLRDLKLKRFVFADEERRKIRLEGLEEANIIDSDQLMNIDRADKIACPAYVCPELLTLEVGKPFFGQAADIWSCGVMMYTIILGRYPFSGSNPIQVFTAIRKGVFEIPDTVSSRAKCLIRNMMKRDPLKRWKISKALKHPWFERITYANHEHDSRIPDRQTSDIHSDKLGDDIDDDGFSVYVDADDELLSEMN